VVEDNATPWLVSLGQKVVKVEDDTVSALRPGWGTGKYGNQEGGCNLDAS
jgi:hypothetical protein